MSIQTIYRVLKNNGDLAGEYMDKKLADLHDQKLDSISAIAELISEQAPNLDEAEVEAIAEHLVNNKANLMAALIYLRDSSTFTVPRGLKALLDQFGFGGNWNWEIVVTASVITTIPMIVLFFLAQRHFVEGIATTGAKN